MHGASAPASSASSARDQVWQQAQWRLEHELRVRSGVEARREKCQRCVEYLRLNMPPDEQLRLAFGVVDKELKKMPLPSDKAGATTKRKFSEHVPVIDLTGEEGEEHEAFLHQLLAADDALTDDLSMMWMEALSESKSRSEFLAEVALKYGG